MMAIHGVLDRTLKKETRHRESGEVVVHFIDFMQDGCLVTRTMTNGHESAPRVLYRTTGVHTCWKRRWTRDEKRTVNELSVLGYGEDVKVFDADEVK